LQVKSEDRVNFVVWLFGQYGDMRITSYKPSVQQGADDIWE
jgi:hypothetical protein